MKKVVLVLTAFACLTMVSCGNLNQVLSTMTNNTGVINAISSVIGLDKIKVQNLMGTWKYCGPGNHSKRIIALYELLC